LSIRDFRLLAAAGLMATASVAVAQPAPSAPPKLTGVRVPIEAAADALGMVRGIGGRTGNKAIVAMRFTANGSMTDAAGKAWQVKSVIGDVAHYVPASRLDWQLVGPGGATERRIEVVNGKVAWNETTPGVGAEPAPADARRQAIWLAPHAVIWAAIDAADKVTMAKEGAKTVLTIPSPADGLPIRATLNEKNLPEKVEATVGGRPVEALYSDYRDPETYRVAFPYHIVHRSGGQTVLDLTVTDAHTNPYVVFPVPASLKQAAK